jgi:putative DNA primase/helicase
VTIDDLLARFDRKTRTGDQWLVRCPAHDDRKASLAVRSGDKAILLNCHAGCTYEAVLAAMNLSTADLYPDQPQQGCRREVATYDYRDETGTLLYQVVRFEPKDFRPRRPDGAGGWTWHLKGVRRVLYRLHGLRGKEVAVIVEGEKDVDALWNIGIWATCNMGGAGKWRDEYSCSLRRA